MEEFPVPDHQRGGKKQQWNWGKFDMTISGVSPQEDDHETNLLAYIRINSIMIPSHQKQIISILNIRRTIFCHYLLTE